MFVSLSLNRTHLWRVWFCRLQVSDQDFSVHQGAAYPHVEKHVERTGFLSFRFQTQAFEAVSPK